jgi:hypothetical protein
MGLDPGRIDLVVLRYFLMDAKEHRLLFRGQPGVAKRPLSRSIRA